MICYNLTLSTLYYDLNPGTRLFLTSNRYFCYDLLYKFVSFLFIYIPLTVFTNKFAKICKIKTGTRLVLLIYLK